MPDDAYDRLVKKSVIKENYADKKHSELNNIYMIPCDQIDMFYNDSLFYLHFHYSLYTALLYYNLTNNFDITTFTTLWNGLNIQLVDTAGTSGSTSNRPFFSLASVVVSNGGAGYTNSPKLLFTPTGGASIEVGTVVVKKGLKKNIQFTAPLTSISGFVVGDTITFNTPSGGIPAVGRVLSVDANKKITEIEMTERGTEYTDTPTVYSYTLNGTLKTNQGSDIIGITFTASDITDYITQVTVTTNSRIYESTGTFSITSAPPGGINAQITPTINIEADIGTLSSDTFSFNKRIFTNYYNSILQYYTSGYNRIDIRRPRITNISALTSRDTNLIDSTTVNQSSKYTRASLNSDYSLSGDTYYSSSSSDHTNRKKKFNKTLKAILSQDATEILGYLAYQIRYYNIIVLNTSIQRTIYSNYLKNNSLDMNTVKLFETVGSTKGAGVDNLNAIITHIDNMKANLIEIERDIKTTNNIYSDTTKQYPEKINLLNQNKLEYDKIQNSLNIVIKDYNQHYDNYNRLKNYASIIIIFIVILIIASIAVTVLPYFNANAKNTYYILMLILIIILTILFYNNFSHINLYERFTTINCINDNKYKTNYSDGSLNNANIKNNNEVFNKISEKISEYNKESDAVNYQMSSGIYVADTVLTQDADNYINDIYLTKIKKINIYKTKHTELKNLIETMKQQIIYLYNIIIILCIFIIILLIALILYVNMPYATNYIIAFVTISIFILVIYYVYAIVKPTRLVANKNYWADHNPSKTTVSKL